MCYEFSTRSLFDCSVQLTLTLLILPVSHFLAQQDVENLCKKGAIKGSIRENPSMILNYKNKTIFVTLIFQDVIYFIYQQSVDDHHSSRGIKPHIMMFTMLDFLWKIVSTSMMQSAIWRGESVEILLVPHWTAIFPTYNGSGKMMARQSTFSTRSPPMPKLIVISDTKYFPHTVWYLASPALMESPNRSVLRFATFIVRQWLRWHSIQLDLLKRPHAFKAIKNIPKRKADFNKICKVIFCNARNSNLWRY